MAIQKLRQLQSIFEEVLPLLKFGELKEFRKKEARCESEEIPYDCYLVVNVVF
jgi:hypothetical protein